VKTTEKKVDTETPLKLYESFGMRFSKSGDQGIGECPFCNKNRFYVALQERKRTGGAVTVPGMFSCQSCGISGNQYTFVTALHSESVQRTDDDDYARIAKLRKMPAKIFKFHKMAVSILTSEWLFPAFNASGGMTNLYRWREPTEKYQKNPFVAAPEPLQHGLLNLHALRTNKLDRPIIVVEGQWDLLAMDHVLKSIGKHKEFDLLAVPGTHVFKDGWEKHFKERDVILVYDNDHEKKKGNRVVCPGRDGMDRVQNRLVATDCLPNRIRRIDWPKGLPDGFDVRDLFNAGGKP